jgi:hypothetical protein
MPVLRYRQPMLLVAVFCTSVWVNNDYGGRSTGTSAVPQIADDFGAPRKSAEVGQ